MEIFCSAGIKMANFELKKTLQVDFQKFYTRQALNIPVVDLFWEIQCSAREELKNATEVDYLRNVKLSKNS